MKSRGPQPISDLLAQWMTQRGIGRVRVATELTTAWNSVVGEALAAQTRVGELKRGILDVRVAHSLLVQELTFQQSDLLARLQPLLPGQALKKLRLKVGPLD